MPHGILDLQWDSSIVRSKTNVLILLKSISFFDILSAKHQRRFTALAALHSSGGIAQLWPCCTALAALHSSGGFAQLWLRCTALAALHSSGDVAQLWPRCTALAALHSYGSVAQLWPRCTALAASACNSSVRLCWLKAQISAIRSHFYPKGTPTKRPVTKHLVTKRPVAKRPVTERPGYKRPVYKTSSLPDVHVHNVQLQNVLLRKKNCKTCLLQKFCITGDFSMHIDEHARGQGDTLPKSGQVSAYRGALGQCMPRGCPCTGKYDTEMGEYITCDGSGRGYLGQVIIMHRWI